MAGMGGEENGGFRGGGRAEADIRRPAILGRYGIVCFERVTARHQTLDALDNNQSRTDVGNYANIFLFNI